MKKLSCVLLILAMLASFWGCSIPVPPETTTEPSTEATTLPVTDDIEHFDINEIDLAGIGELLVEREQDGLCKIQLDGLCTPVVLELEGTDLVSISAYGNTVSVNPNAEEYISIYGNLWPVIYEHNGLIFLNIWHDDVGYSCVVYPDGTYSENYPDGEYSVMLYVDKNNQMIQYQFAMKFRAIEQWDTGPIDTATNRNNFYYSIDYAEWSGSVLSVTSGESYTISDCYDLDAIFQEAKDRGVYPDFETVDELLAYNAARQDNPNAPDSSQEEIRYFDELFSVRDYDGQGNLLSESYYTMYGDPYFEKTFTYDARNLEISGTWHFQGEENYHYTNTYDGKDRLTETVWYQAEEEVERFAYTYDKNGTYTETFFQRGEKKYTYTFNGEGELTAHTVYHNGKAQETEDVSKLVKTELLTDIWYPIIDSEPLHFFYHYDGTTVLSYPSEGALTVAEDGSQILIHGSVDEEDGRYYESEHQFNAQGQLVAVIYREEDTETSREEYQYDESGLKVMTWYEKGKKVQTTTYQYDKDGQLIRTETDYENPETYPTEDRDIITYTTGSQTFRYNDRGLLVETVVYCDEEEVNRVTYEYDDNGYPLPSTDTFQYMYNSEGVLEEIWLIYEDHAAGAALLRSRTVYVTPDNARQLQQILRDELSWF